MANLQEYIAYLRRLGFNSLIPGLGGEETEEEEEEDNNYEKYNKEWFAEQNIPITMNCDTDINEQEMWGHHIPDEVLTHIFTTVEPQVLLQCRLVCHKWRNIIDSQIWLWLLDKKVYRQLRKIYTDSETPFTIFYKVYINDPFNRNLLKNPSGEEGLRHWTITENGGDHWIVEKPPSGSFPLPEDSTSCFVTSFGYCSKEQVIDLTKLGLLPVIMDEIHPKIYVSEIFAARFDCASTYKLDVALLDRNRRELDKFTMQESILCDPWKKVEHYFCEYPSGVRFVRFTHSGKDNQFWKGHYGSKMSQACVKVLV